MKHILFAGLVSLGFVNLGLVSSADAGPVTITSNVTTTGAVTLTAPDDATDPVFDNAVVQSGVTVRSTSSSVTINAGDDMILEASSTIAAATSLNFFVDYGNADPGSGGTASLLGNLDAPLATVTGGADADLFQITPDDTTPITVIGGGLLSSPGDVLIYLGNGGTVKFTGIGAGVISASGVADVFFQGIENIQGATVAVPEPSTFALLGLGSIALAGYGWRRKRQQAA